MKKLKLLVLAFGLLIVAGSSAYAQNKTGYISVDNMVALMPETAKLDTLIKEYQTDSLQPRFNYTLTQFQRKDSIVNGKDSLKTPAAVRVKMREEMQQDLYELQNWQAIVQQATEAKQNQLLAPIYQKVYAAIQTVAKDNGYAYVYNKEALLVAPPADDLLPLVAKKLNVKLPPGATAGK
ncbi:MAG TPA: OmpH family outer membrane protein [Chitinophagaceae bacterium]